MRGLYNVGDLSPPIPLNSLKKNHVASFVWICWRRRTKKTLGRTFLRPPSSFGILLRTLRSRSTLDKTMFEFRFGLGLGPILWWLGPLVKARHFLLARDKNELESLHLQLLVAFSKETDIDIHNTRHVFLKRKKKHGLSRPPIPFSGVGFLRPHKCPPGRQARILPLQPG